MDMHTPPQASEQVHGAEEGSISPTQIYPFVQQPAEQAGMQEEAATTPRKRDAPEQAPTTPSFGQEVTLQHAPLHSPARPAAKKTCMQASPQKEAFTRISNTLASLRSARASSAASRPSTETADDMPPLPRRWQAQLTSESSSSPSQPSQMLQQPEEPAAESLPHQPSPPQHGPTDQFGDEIF